MSTKSSAATIMAWNWVIQSVAKFKQVDSPTLTGLVKSGPAISDDLGKDSREIVCLQILENLFIHENEDTVETENDKISFDLSEQCEDVLHKILEETSEPMTELEKQKWNVRPFMVHKRASLPKSPLQKFKDLLLQGNSPILESLRKRTSLLDENVSENTAVMDDLVSDNTANEEKLKEKDNFTKEITGKEDEMSKIPPAPNVSNIGEEKTCMEKNVEVEISCDSDDEMNDIAAKKSAFLSSQFTLSQDSMASPEIFVCMKCNKNGEFLVCNSDSCPFRVHKTCLGSNATFDENGKFFCPFCAYSRAISKYMEVKKKAALARQDLQLFLSSGAKIEHTPKISSKKEGCPVDEVNGGEDSMSRGKEDCAPVDLPRRSTHRAGTPKRKFNEKEDIESYSFTHSKRSCKRDPQYSSLRMNVGRRKTIWWTKSEEEILKEGIMKFGAVNNKIPWKEILDFGCDVFDKSRTTIDLKDKWRNLCKQTPPSPLPSTSKKPKL